MRTTTGPGGKGELTSMRELFVEDGVNMSHSTGISSGNAADEVRRAVEGRYVCPFCGAVREQAEGICPRCTMESTAATRQATKSRIGPWYVLQTRNPAAPGMMFDTLLAFVGKGRVKPRSIVRGPTTHQLWRFAAHVRGLSREFGVCYSCGEGVAQNAAICPHCNRQQEPPANPDVFLENQDLDHHSGPIPIFRDLPKPRPAPQDDLVVPDIEESTPQDAAHDASQAAAGDEKVSSAKKGTDGFLTAADLAAAFKLDFQPKGHKRKKATVAPIAMTAEPRIPVRAHRRSRPWKRYVLLLLFMASIGAGAFQYHRDPSFRARVLDLYGAGLTRAKQKWAELNKPAAKPVHTPPTATNVNVVEVGPSAPTPQANSGATQPAAPASPWDQLYGQGKVEKIVPAEKPAPEKKPAVDKIAPPEVPLPEVVVSPKVAPPAPPAVPVATAGGIDDVRALYRAAIDAEAGGDYAGAVKKYSQIKEYPSDLWPRDLELRLKAAEQFAKP